MVLHPSFTLEVKLIKLSKNHEKNHNSLRRIVIDSFVKEKLGMAMAKIGDDFI